MGSTAIASEPLTGGKSEIFKITATGKKPQSDANFYSNNYDRIVHSGTEHSAGFLYTGYYEGTRSDYKRRLDVAYSIQQVRPKVTQLCPVCSYPLSKCKYPEDHLGPIAAENFENFENYEEIYEESDNAILNELATFSAEERQQKVNELEAEIRSEVQVMPDKTVFDDIYEMANIMYSESEQGKYLEKFSQSLRNKILLYLKDPNLKSEMELKVMELQSNIDVPVREKARNIIKPVLKLLDQKQKEERKKEYIALIKKLGSDASKQSMDNELKTSNYPNPFNPKTTISYQLDKAGIVDLSIYNSLGQKLRTLVNKKYQLASEYSVVWNGQNESGEKIASGIYFYKLQVGSRLITKKMVLMK
jgi:hypothetical protein